MVHRRRQGQIAAINTQHASIANELAGSSVFFQPAPAAQRQGQPVGELGDEPQAQQPAATTPATTAPATVAALPPGNHATTVPATQPGMAAAAGELPEPAMLEEVRKAARQIGKEAATHRFTAVEKRQLAEIVYTYARQGTKTSENEITRIAVNWLLLDYRRHGDQSVLAKLLDSLHG